MAEPGKSEPFELPPEIDEMGVLLKDLESNTPVPQPLVHYTTARGLEGILTSKALWASMVGFSNDTSEGRYATELGARIVEKHPIVKDSKCSSYCSIVRGLFLQPCIFEETFVVSFCQTSDVLTQWRTYGGEGSFAIAMDLNRHSLVCDASDEVRVAKVIYDKVTQETLLSNALDVVQRAANKFVGRADVEQGIAVFLYFFVTQWACAVKHQAFSDEREWRISVLPMYKRKSVRELLGGNVKRVFEVLPKVRVHRTHLLPYVEVTSRSRGFEPGKFDVRAVMVGPSPSQEIEAKGVEILREALGTRFSIEKSTIPTR